MEERFKVYVRVDKDRTKEEAEAMVERIKKLLSE